MKYLLLTFLISITVSAQDEWFFKDMLRGKSIAPAAAEQKVHFKEKSSAYQIDISGDSVKEYIRFDNEDGKVFVNIYSSRKKKLLRYKFQIKGFDSQVYKISRKHLSKNRVLTIFHFFEGKTNYLEKTGTSAIYGLVVENGNLKNIQIQRLGYVWLEKEFRDTYIRRPYELSYMDINKDGQKEVIINSGQVKKVLFYQGDNKWVGL